MSARRPVPIESRHWGILWSSIGLLCGGILAYNLSGARSDEGVLNLSVARSSVVENSTRMPVITEFVAAPRETEPADHPAPSQASDEAVEPPLTPPVLEVQPGRLAWEAQIDALIASNLSDTAIARLLLNQLPIMPAEAYSRLAQEAVDRLPDRDYAAVAFPILLNPATNGAAEAVLYADLLERPDAVALPALLALARNSGHSFADTARETLTLLVGTDFGTDWKRWESAVAGLLADPQ